MSELPPDELSIAADRGDPGRRKAAAPEAHRTQTCGLPSWPGAPIRARDLGSAAVGTVPVPRHHNLVLVGERPFPAPLFLSLIHI